MIARRSITATRLILLASLFLVAFDNLSFWNKVLQRSDFNVRTEEPLYRVMTREFLWKSSLPGAPLPLTAR